MAGPSEFFKEIDVKTEWTVAVIIGSLRKASINRQLAKALVAMAPSSLKLVVVEIGALPLCNQDDDEHSPAASIAFRDSVRAADALLFVTPEYNRSIPSPLKNALDVGSRPFGQSIWSGKPGAVVSASPSPMGGFGANHHLRQSLVALNVPTLPQPEIYFGFADKVFDGSDNALDDATRRLLTRFMAAFAAWVGANAR
jgi:chromate reductase